MELRQALNHLVAIGFHGSAVGVPVLGYRPDRGWIAYWSPESRVPESDLVMDTETFSHYCSAEAYWGLGKAVPGCDCEDVARKQVVLDLQWAMDHPEIFGVVLPRAEDRLGQ